MLTSLPLDYKEFIFSYLKYYNSLDPNGFQFALKNNIIRKPEIINLISLFKNKFPEIALSDFLNERIRENLHLCN